MVICKVLGTEELNKYLKKYRLKMDPHLEALLLGSNNYPRKDWKKFVNADNQALASEDAIDLLARMLVYDHVLFHYKFLG